MSNKKYLFVFLLLGHLATFNLKAQNQLTVFKNVNVVSMTKPEVGMLHTVVIKDGFIEIIDSTNKYAIPKNALVIDGKGRYLMPGLADMHTHLTHPEAQHFAEDNLATMNLLLANGITTIRNMWGSEELLEFSKKVNSGEILGPRIYTTGPFVIGRPDTLTTAWNADEVKNNPTYLFARTEEDGRAISKYHKDMGYHFVKVHNNTTLLPYKGLVNENAVPVIGHAPRPIGLAKIFTIGKQSSIEHYDMFVGLAEQSTSPAKKSQNWYDQYFGSYSYANDERILLLAELVKSSGMYFTPTIIISEWYNGSQSKMLLHLKDPDIMKYTSKQQRDIWFEYATGFASNYEKWNLDMTNQKNFALRLTYLFHKSRVPLLLGTDATPVMGIQGQSTLEELELLVEAGLTPFEAIKTGTVNVHEYLQKAGLKLGTGTIVVGEPADLILLEENPLINIGNIKKIMGVMTQGRWLNEEKLTELTKKAEEIYSN